MSSIRKTFVAVLALLAAVPGVAEAGVVVAASGPSASGYPVGRKLGASDRIVLQAGDVLTVLDGTSTRVLRGAGNFTLGQRAAGNQRGTFAVLTERRPAARMRTGAVRNAGLVGPVTQPNLWYVDVTRPGKVCLAGTESVRLWRASSQAPASYAIAGNGGTSQQVSFGEGEALAAWNVAAMPVTPGGEYRITGPDGRAGGAVTFAVLAEPAADPEALAGQLIANGCTAQLELLSNAMLIAQG